MLAFEMTAEIAEEFFKRVAEQKAETELERTAILVQMAKEGLMNRISYSDRTKQQYVEDISKEFRVLEIKDEDK